MQFKVSCSSGDTLELSQITPFQGELKYRNQQDVDRIKKSIMKYGFSFPFFVWEHNGFNYVLDGHGRRIALESLQKDGVEIPPLPVVYIQAENVSDAKEKLLRINSQYGSITESTLNDFTKGLDVSFNDIDIRTVEMHIEEKKVPVIPKEEDVAKPVYVPSFADSTPSQESIENSAEELEHRYENEVETNNQNMKEIVCPCCGEVMLFSKQGLIQKLYYAGVL